MLPDLELRAFLLDDPEARRDSLGPFDIIVTRVAPTHQIYMQSQHDTQFWASQRLAFAGLWSL